jgi:HJR/Mrr/RecB family endonuclease
MKLVHFKNYKTFVMDKHFFACVANNSVTIVNVQHTALSQARTRRTVILL